MIDTIKQGFDSRITLHFAHANGFPAASYNKLFSAFPEHWKLLALDKFGHDERFPVNNNWRNQADELLIYLDKHTDSNDRIYAVGHSFGAVISYIAACIRPEKFNGLIMLDPPLATGFSRHAFALAKKTRFIDKLTPAKLAHSRRRSWHRETDLVQYFEQRGLFKSMDRECIVDYVNAVMQEKGQENVLSFKPEIEAQVFRTIPDNLHCYTGQLDCPATIITGEQTKVCVPFLRNAFIKQNRLTHTTMPGGHMFPLETPISVAQTITDIINKDLFR